MTHGLSTWQVLRMGAGFRHGLALMLACCLNTPGDVMADRPGCIEPGAASADGPEVRALRAQIHTLQTQWAAGKFAGPDRFSGTTTTNGSIEAALAAQESELNQLLVAGEDYVAFSGAVSNAGSAIQAAIERARQAGNGAQVTRLQGSYATWQESVARKRAAMEASLRRLDTVLRDLGDRYNEKIAILERRAGADLDSSAGATTCGEESAPRIRSLDEQIDECLSRADVVRDLCLANLVLLHQDPAPCAAAPEGQCSDLVGRVVMRDCAVKHAGADVARCEYTVATWIGLPGVCRHATDPDACFTTVAVETADPGVIVESIEDEAVRDRMLATYATLAGDDTAFERITDNRRHDDAVIYAAAGIGFGADRRLDQSYCQRLRGGYSGEYASEDAQMNRDLCRAAVILSNYALDRDQAATTLTQREQIINDFEQLVQRLANGELTLDDLLRH